MVIGDRREDQAQPAEAEPVLPFGEIDGDRSRAALPPSSCFEG
jgi:hypothetical protein